MTRSAPIRTAAEAVAYLREMSAQAQGHAFAYKRSVLPIEEEAVARLATTLRIAADQIERRIPPSAAAKRKGRK